MKQLLRKLIHGQSGSVSVMITALMSVLIMLGALAVDMGTVYVAGAKIQTAADAAMLAAGSFLPIKTNDFEKQRQVTTLAAQYLEKNGVTNPADYKIYLQKDENGKYTTLGVDVKGAVPAGFAKIFGVEQLSFQKTAEVKTMVCVRLTDVIPLSVQKSTLQDALDSGKTTHIYLKYGAKNPGAENGNFGAIDLDGVQGGGANDFEKWLTNGFSGELSVSSQLYPVESGNMAGPTQRAFTSRYNACTHYAGSGGCTYEHYFSFCPRVVKVPIVEYDSKKRVRITGFAAFVLESAGRKDEVTGSYVDMVTVGSSGADPTGDAPDYGVYSLMLSK